MNLDINKWKEFKIDKLFYVSGSKTTSKEFLEEKGEGKFPYVTTSAQNNGVDEYYDYWTEIGNVITVESACMGFATYQKENFSASDHVEILKAKFNINQNISLFFVTLINNENFKFSYGRKCNQNKIKNTILKLPIKYNENETIFIDETYKYSENGYTPDFEFMEKYIKELNYKPVSTKNKKSLDLSTLNVNEWKEFKIETLFDVFTGGDLIISETEIGDIPVASNSCENNNIAFYSAPIKKRKLFDSSKSISIADRGKFWAFTQSKDFYIGTRVKALVSRYEDINIYQLIFISSVLNLESYKYSYGRNCCDRLNKIIIKLPAQKNKNEFVIDNSCKYSNKGYIPDFGKMEEYIKSFPYGDRII